MLGRRENIYCLTLYKSLFSFHSWTKERYSRDKYKTSLKCMFHFKMNCLYLFKEIFIHFS